MSKANYNKSPLNTSSNKIKSLIISAPDKTLLTAVMFLIIIGFMAIFSTTGPKCLSDGLSPFLFLNKQIVAFIAGFFAMLFFTNFSYKNLEKFNGITFTILIIMLIMVKFTPLGVNVNGATRWINFCGLQLQPSEFAKPIFVMLLASTFKHDASLLDSKKWISTFAPLLGALFLIFIQPNLSMVMLLVVTTFIMFICAGGALPIILGAIGTFFAGVFAIILKLATATIMAGGAIKSYQLGRIKTWLNPELDPLGKGYNIIQSLIAFASGGIMGLGYGSSVQKRAYLPECHTDFIFAVIAEEWGFVGCLFIIILFLTIMYRGILIASNCQDMYGKLLAIGLTFSIGIQAFINMGVTSSFIPATGVPLPFISYGGSSLFTSMIMIGILLNISKRKITKIGNSPNEQKI